MAGVLLSEKCCGAADSPRLIHPMVARLYDDFTAILTDSCKMRTVFPNDEGIGRVLAATWLDMSESCLAPAANGKWLRQMNGPGLCCTRKPRRPLPPACAAVSRRVSPRSDGPADYYWVASPKALSPDMPQPIVVSVFQRPHRQSG